MLEALIEGPAPNKQKKRLLKALRGSWAALAAEFGGSHLVEKCYSWAVRFILMPDHFLHMFM